MNEKKKFTLNNVKKLVESKVHKNDHMMEILDIIIRNKLYRKIQ